MLPLLLIAGGLLSFAMIDVLGWGHDPVLDDLPASIGLLAGFVLAGQRFVGAGLARPGAWRAPGVAGCGCPRPPVGWRRRLRAAVLARRLIWGRRMARRFRRRPVAAPPVTERRTGARTAAGHDDRAQAGEGAAKHGASTPPAPAASPPAASPPVAFSPATPAPAAPAGPAAAAHRRPAARAQWHRPDPLEWLGYSRRWLVQAPLARHRSERDGLVVIGGAPRSGTTLLRTLLGRHPAIASLPETTVFLRRISPPAEIARRLGWPVADIARWQRSSRSQVEFIERLHAAVLARSGKPIWAEKTPLNVLRFGFVRRAFPRAKLVHILRDGRDVACSLRHRPFAKLDGAAWDTPAAALRCGVQWRACVRAGLRHRSDPDYWEVRYEDLVRHPEPVLRALLDFLDLPWHDCLLVAEETGADPDERRAAGAVSVGAIGRWHGELSAAQCAALEPLIGPLLETLGYAESPGWSAAPRGDVPQRFPPAGS